MPEVGRCGDVMYYRPFGLYQTKFCGGPALLLLEACQIGTVQTNRVAGGQADHRPF
jgi:hypothetical protein